MEVDKDNMQLHLENIGQSDLQQVWNWNATVSETIETVVHDLIAETVRKQPDTLAICAWDGEWTYAELDDVSTRLAHHLVSLGVGPEVIVPLCFEKSRWTPVAMLAVMKAGGASVALDSSLPEERLRTIVDQVEPVLILSSPDNQCLASRLTPRLTVVIDDAHVHNFGALGKRELPTVQPWHKIYIVFTSGSTGTPKGVVITHSNISSAIRYQREILGIKSKSRVYDFASYMFDVVWCNLLQTLSAGACLCIPSDEDRQKDFVVGVNRYSADMVIFTPSAVRGFNQSILKDLRHLHFIGEPLYANDIKDINPGPEVSNLYGPTECTTLSTARVFQEADGPQASIGKGIGLNTWIVSPSDHDCLAPLGTIGELLLEGPLVGAGYLGDLEKTAAAFIKDPKWLLRGAPGQPGRHGRLYKTGDLVRYNSDGNLAFVGRKDNQVKINGQRVELGDVEYHIRMNLLSSSEVVQIIADVLVPNNSKKSMLVAFIHIASKDDNKSQDDLNRLNSRLDDKLATKLPAYMIPSVYIAVKIVPMTATGKADRRSLRAMGERMTLEELTRLNSTERRLPTTSMERKLQEVWSTVLGVKIDLVGVNDSFLRIGGDSIGAMKLVEVARERGLYLTVANVFKQPRLEDMARVVGELPGLGNGQAIEPFSLLKAGFDIQKVHSHITKLCDTTETTIQIEDVFPCTPLQEGLLALSAKRPGDYIAQLVFELQSTIDLDIFCKAWEEVQRTTPILRTRIIDVIGQGLVQVVLDQLVVQWPSKADVNSLSSYTQADKQLNMELGSPLVRVAIVEEDENMRFFVLTIHHALYDGWSMPLMIQRLYQAYQGERKLAYPPPFQGFVQHIMDADLDQAMKFWKTEFEGSEAQTFPALPSPTYQPTPDNSITHQIQDLQWPQTDITASSAVRTAWSILAMFYTGSNDVVFGVALSGRQADVPGINQMVGPTLATVPVRVELYPEQTIEQLLLQVQAQAVDITAVEQIGLQHIRRVSDSAERVCEFQTLLVIHPIGANSTETSNLFTKINGNENDNAFIAFSSYAISIQATLGNDGVGIRIEFDSSIVDSQQAKRMVIQLEHIIRLVCDPEKGQIKLADIDMISPEDLRDIWSWNKTVPDTIETAVHDLIAETVRKQPDALAICAWDG
jgi:amino acid adenylation domain-containing protein